jgi:pyridoxamine 5'-phosphate oxidase
MNISELRLSYTRAALHESTADPDGVRQFASWFDQALAADVPEPNAMALATADERGIPNLRMVLLKSFDARGFVFYTNYASRKGRELESNPHAALLFHWPELERQVRINGIVSRVSEEESDAYFSSRPRGHQIGAWASDQSAVVPDRDAVDGNALAAAARFSDVPIPRPPHWGGYLVRPEVVEFWQGRENRLHDRLEYLRADGGWRIQRLSP